MKKTFLIFLSYITVLISAENPFEIQSRSTADVSKYNSQNSHFRYFSTGITANTQDEIRSVAPDLFVGVRHSIAPGFAIDAGGGSCFTNNRDFASVICYGQASFLVYPDYFIGSDPFNGGTYLGVGFTAGIITSGGTWFNVPATLGYQFISDKGNPQFMQIQLTPLYSGTVSYGFGF